MKKIFFLFTLLFAGAITLHAQHSFVNYVKQKSNVRIENRFENIEMRSERTAFKHIYVPMTVIPEIVTIEVETTDSWISFTNNVRVIGPSSISYAGGLTTRKLTNKSNTYTATANFLVLGSTPPNIPVILQFLRPGGSTSVTINTRNTIRIKTAENSLGGENEIIRNANATSSRLSNTQTITLRGVGFQNLVTGVKTPPSNHFISRISIKSKTDTTLTFNCTFNKSGTLTYESFVNTFLSLQPNTIATYFYEDIPLGKLIGLDKTILDYRFLCARFTSATCPPLYYATIPPRQPPLIGGSRSSSQRPDLHVDFESYFIKPSSMQDHTSLCPSPTAPANSSKINNMDPLTIRVTNIGTGSSSATTLNFFRKHNSNFSRDETFSVGALAPGESQSFTIQRRNSTIATLLNPQRACVLTTPDSQWTDAGIEATVTTSTNETVTDNNRRILP